MWGSMLYTEHSVYVSLFHAAIGALLLVRSRNVRRGRWAITAAALVACFYGTIGATNFALWMAHTGAHAPEEMHPVWKLLQDMVRPLWKDLGSYLPPLAIGLLVVGLVQAGRAGRTHTTHDEGRGGPPDHPAP